jgi:hypothetical protein
MRCEASRELYERFQMAGQNVIQHSLPMIEQSLVTWFIFVPTFMSDWMKPSWMEIKTNFVDWHVSQFAHKQTCTRAGQ